MKSPVKNFVVISTQRTGSSWVMDVINSFENTEGHQELLLDHPRLKPSMAGCNDYPRFFEQNRSGSFLTRPIRLFGYLNRLYSRPVKVGFKLMYSHIRNYPETIAYIAMKRIAVIHLVRENDLDVVISEKMASVVGSSHASIASKSEIPTIELPTSDLIYKLEKLDRHKRIFRRLLKCLPIKHTEVRYESLTEEGFSQVAGFLDSPSNGDTTSVLKKRQTKAYQDVLSNWEEVKTVIERDGRFVKLTRSDGASSKQ